jgi:hypothetical protein
MHQAARWLGVAVVAALFAVPAGAVTASHFYPMTVGAVDGVWTTDLDAAKALAAANDRPMLVYVGNTAECAYCRLSEEKVLLLAEWKSYAVSRGLALVYLDKTDPRYMPFVAGTVGQFPCFSVYLCPTPTTLSLKGRFIYRPWSTTTPQFIYNGIKVVQNPANFISIVESFVGSPVAPLPVMTGDYADVRGDAIAAEATELIPLIKPQLTPKHSLNGTDTEDWFRMPVAAGRTYRLQNFGVRIVGATAPTLTVYKDDPAGAPVTQYLLSNTNVHDFVAATTGAYYFRVSRPVTAETVDVNYWLMYQWYVAPPVVIGPPDAFVGMGETASFTVTAQGEGPFTYQWYKGAYILSGATANSYAVALTLANKGATFKCKVTNLGGTTYSRVATLSERVGAKLKVTLLPAAVVTAGASWSPDAGATWYGSGATVTLGTGNYTISFEPKAGWTTPAPLPAVLTSAYVTTPLALTATYTAAALSLSPDTLSLSSNQQDRVINVTATTGLAWTATPSTGWITIVGPASGTGSGSFTVRVSNNSGLAARSGSVAVGSASLAITQAPYEPGGSSGPLTIVEQPQSQKVLYGKTATLRVRATGTGPITYQWRKPTLVIAGATASDYTTPAVAATYTYSCLVRNAVSSKTSAYATITVVRMWRTITGHAVAVAVVPASTTSTWTVTEKIPAGLTPADYAASGGTWSASLRTIVWKSTGKKTVSYTVSGAAGTYALAGTVKWSALAAALTTEGDTALTLPGTLATLSADAAAVTSGVGFTLQAVPALP